MAREAYRSLYGDLTKLKDDSLLKDPAAGAADDPELFQLLLATSDWVDSYTNRHFYPRIQTLEFDGPGQERLLLPDLVGITSLKEDTTENETYTTTWTATDYWLEPHNAEPTEHWGRPYTSLRVRTKGTKSTFTVGQHRFQIVGRWGYREFKEDSGSNLNDAAMTTTKVTIAVTVGTDFAIGQTIMIGAEQMLVTNIAANNLTCTRALNGTTGFAHADNADVYILRWPLSIERAALIQAARVWTRAADFEPAFVDEEVDTDVRLLLNPYRRLPV